MTAATPTLMKMGSCDTAALVTSGVVRSTTSAEDWHAECAGAVVSLNGSETRCTCECHVGVELVPLDLRRICIDCGDEGERDKSVRDGRRTCVDRDACAETQQVKAAADPRFASMLAARESTATMRFTRREEEAARPPGTNRKGGRCEHCGQLTAGGRFAPGHDAKLKSELTAAARADDPDAEALAELYVRKWPAPGDIHDDIADLARAISEADDVGAWLAARNAARQEAAA